MIKLVSREEPVSIAKIQEIEPEPIMPKEPRPVMSQTWWQRVILRVALLIVEVRGMFKVSTQ